MHTKCSRSGGGSVDRSVDRWLDRECPRGRAPKVAGHGIHPKKPIPFEMRMRATGTAPFASVLPSIGRQRQPQLAGYDYTPTWTLDSPDTLNMKPRRSGKDSTTALHDFSAHCNGKMGASGLQECMNPSHRQWTSRSSRILLSWTCSAGGVRFSGRRGVRRLLGCSVKKRNAIMETPVRGALPCCWSRCLSLADGQAFFGLRDVILPSSSCAR